MIKHCTQCGSKVIYKTPSGDERQRAVCTNCGYIHYENPTIVAGILPRYKDQILLCKRAIKPQKGFWTIPSGFMELNETVEEAALREAQEEAGVTAQIDQLYCLYNLPHIGQVYMLYLATMDTQEFKEGIETQEARFFDLEDIPWDDIAFSSVTFALKHYVSDFESKRFKFRTGEYLGHKTQ